MSLVENMLIILTCTVNVNHNKSHIYQQNANDRLECYLKSIKQWLELTNFNICVIENSGYKLLELDEYTKKYNNRFEILTFNELNLTNGLEHLIYNCSKGASEMYSIIYAYSNTKFKNNINFVIKITGRYFIPNFQNVLIRLNIISNTKHVNIHYNNNMIIGLHQSNHMRCEIIGIHRLFFNIMFHLNLSDDNNRFYPHVEYIYHNRFKLLNNIVTLPVFKIEPTQMGGIETIVDEL